MDSPILILAIAPLFAFAVESQRIPNLQPPESPSPPSPTTPSLVSLPSPHPPPRKPPAHKRNGDLGSPPRKGKVNKAKKIGLMFAGVASLLQVCIVAFLIISRRQLLKAPKWLSKKLNLISKIQILVSKWSISFILPLLMVIAMLELKIEGAMLLRMKNLKNF